jgi:hypothetical protein
MFTLSRGQEPAGGMSLPVILELVSIERRVIFFLQDPRRKIIKFAKIAKTSIISGYNN